MKVKFMPILRRLLIYVISKFLENQFYFHLSKKQLFLKDNSSIIFYQLTFMQLFLKDNSSIIFYQLTFMQLFSFDKARFEIKRNSKNPILKRSVESR
jgi:hypothetical protein